MPGLRTAGRHAGNTSTADGAPDWRTSAACIDVDPETFFPVGRQGRRRLGAGAPDLAAPAKAICRRCPVVRDCLKEAIGTAVEGIWGGTTLDERDELREQYGITPEPVRATVLGDDRVADVARLSGGGVLGARHLHRAPDPAQPNPPVPHPRTPARPDREGLAS